MEKTGQTTAAGLGFYIKNMFLISIFWIVCSIPVFTIGASCSAAYRTVHRVLYRKDQETWKVFRDSFKDNFKKGTKCWIVVAVLGLIFFGIGRYLFQLDWDSNGTSGLGMYYMMFYLMFVYVFLWGMYVFAYNIRFNDSAGVILRNCLYLVVRHLLSTIVMGIIMGVFIYLTVWLKFVVVITPGLAVFCILKIMEKVFSHYMNEDDYRMVWGLEPLEEPQQEDELTPVFKDEDSH